MELHHEIVPSNTGEILAGLENKEMDCGFVFGEHNVNGFEMIALARADVAVAVAVPIFKNLLTQVPGLKLHLDFGHTNFGIDTHEAFCGELGEHIQHVHFSDNRSRSDDHMPLGVGTVNWKNAVNSLKAIGYNSTITLEVFCNDPMQHKYLDLSRELIQELWE